MGFWDSVGKLAKVAGNEIKAANQRHQEYKSEMTYKSDSELARVIKRETSSSPLKSGAAVQELKPRGYDKESISDLMRNE